MVRNACSVCSKPQNISEGKGVKYIVISKTIKIKSGRTEYFLRRKYTTITKSVPNIKFNINGLTSLTPNKKYIRDNNNVHNNEEDEEVKSYLFILQTPCCEKFFAIDIWI
jgi:hypothetical protein